MSAIKIRAALEVALNAMSPAVLTAWENHPFTPPAPSVPFQVAHVLFATPSNSEAGRSHQEIGFMQVKLMYPMQSGSAAATTRAELIRSTFYRGATFTNGGVAVQVHLTPEILPGRNEEGRFAVVVKVPFLSSIPN